MASIITSKLSQRSINVGATSKAALATLLDSDGRLVDTASTPAPDAITHSHTGSAFTGITGANNTVLFINQGTKFVRLRSISVMANNVSGASAAQVGLVIQRFQSTSTEVRTAAAGLIALSTVIGSAYKDSSAPPAQAVIYALSSGFQAAPVRSNIETIFQFAIPLRQASYGYMTIPFDDAGPDAALLLAPFEGIQVVGLSASPPTNAIAVTFDWDEER